jgi:hypothetical protein
MKTKIISIIFLLLLMSSTGKAQDKFGVYSVSLTPGWYQPSMDYWNNTYLPKLGVTETFGGNISLGGNIAFAFPFDLRARVGASYWSDKVTGNDSSTINSLKIAFTRFKVGALYSPAYASFSHFQPYLGIEGQFYLIKNRLDNGADTTYQQGQDYSFAPVIGIERPFGYVLVGLELMYNIGSYTQEVSDGIGVTEQKVSINGPEVMLSVGYKF